MYAHLFENNIIKRKNPLDFKTAMEKFMRHHGISIPELAKKARENEQFVYDVYNCLEAPSERLVHAMDMLVGKEEFYYNDPAKKVVKTEEQKAEEHWQWKDSFPKE